MELTFDIRGNLFPHTRTTITLDEFEEMFVKRFPENSTRHKHIENYKRYIQDFQEQVTPNFIQWVNGSFVTKVINPGDIDFVGLLDYKIAMEKEKLIEAYFKERGAEKHYELDAYIVKLYPENHASAFLTKSDLMYWNDWFSNTKPSRTNKRFPKGYVELLFSEK